MDTEAWIEVLRAACDGSSQAAVGRKIGYSSATINQVLMGTYTSDTGNIRKAVEGALMDVTVDCPVCGEIPMNSCIQHQRNAKKEVRVTNPMRIALYNTCPICPNGGKR